MAMRNGICHICGIHGPLSFEHIPPKAAFNNRPVVRLSFDEAFTLGPDAKPKGKTDQKGMGGYTLCERCNNNTGSWYGNHFVEWCYQGMATLVRAGGNPSLIYLNYVFPLPILKQIVTMFFSVNSSDFQRHHPDLVRFVLNREARFLPPIYRFFVYYNIEGLSRSMGIMALSNIKSGNVSLMSEITYPPFGYVMTINSEPSDKRLFEITDFAKLKYNEFKVMELKLPVLPTHGPAPGDYRSKKQFEEESGITPKEGAK